MWTSRIGALRSGRLIVACAAFVAVTVEGCGQRIGTTSPPPPLPVDGSLMCEADQAPGASTRRLGNELPPKGSSARAILRAVCKQFEDLGACYGMRSGATPLRRGSSPRGFACGRTDVSMTLASWILPSTTKKCLPAFMSDFWRSRSRKSMIRPSWCFPSIMFFGRAKRPLARG
jgi:hypothetical protein